MLKQQLELVGSRQLELVLEQVVHADGDQYEA